MERKYQICNRCVMDTTDPEIVFDENGYCNNCNAAINKLNEVFFIDSEVKKEKLKKIVNQIKFDGKGKKYDCIIGLSGGVDSSYLAYVAVKELNLRPLAIHLDNGWNSELAVKNIDNIINKLGIDLYTHVIDWDEFKNLQISFLKASVIDIEMLTDYAIGETLYRLSKKFGIKYFLSGFNCQSESIMPKTWLYSYKMDSLNIKDIYKKHGNGLRLKTFKFINFYEYLTYGRNQMKLIPILNYIEYNKQDAISKMEKKLDWRSYGNKHEESVFTKFYQSYILPNKFNIDKRKSHLSSLICSKQITRKEALAELKSPILINQDEEINYFIKKLDLEINEFKKIMELIPKDHWEFRSFAKRKQKLSKLYKIFFNK